MLCLVRFLGFFIGCGCFVILKVDIEFEVLSLKAVRVAGHGADDVALLSCTQLDVDDDDDNGDDDDGGGAKHRGRKRLLTIQAIVGIHAAEGEEGATPAASSSSCCGLLDPDHGNQDVHHKSVADAFPEARKVTESV